MQVRGNKHTFLVPAALVTRSETDWKAEMRVLARAGSQVSFIFRFRSGLRLLLTVEC